MVGALRSGSRVGERTQLPEPGLGELRQRTHALVGRKPPRCEELSRDRPLPGQACPLGRRDVVPQGEDVGARGVRREQGRERCSRLVRPAGDEVGADGPHVLRLDSEGGADGLGVVEPRGRQGTSLLGPARRGRSRAGARRTARRGPGPSCPCPARPARRRRSRRPSRDPMRWPADAPLETSPPPPPPDARTAGAAAAASTAAAAGARGAAAPRSRARERARHAGPHEEGQHRCDPHAAAPRLVLHGVHRLVLPSRPGVCDGPVGTGATHQACRTPARCRAAARGSDR